MSDETLFLIDLCSRERGLVPRRPTEPGDGFDWRLFLDCADRHKVVGIAHRAFAKGLAAPPPPEILEKLRREASGKAAVRALLLSEWRRVSCALGSAGLRALTIKGPALSLQLFGSPEFREYRDIDLLADGSSIGEIIELFAALGYEGVHADYETDPRRREFHLRAAPHLVFQKPGFPATFEVHAIKGADIGLAPIKAETAFARSELLRFGGASIPALGRDDHCLLAIIHGAKHAWCLLQWVLDAMAIFENPGIRLDLRARRSWTSIDPSRAAASFADFARKLFDSPALESLPGPSRAGKPVPAGLSAYAEARFAVAGYERTYRRKMIKRSFYLAGLRRGWRAKAEAFSWVVAPSINDFAAMRFADLPLTLYFIIRPALFLARFARRLARRGVAERS